MTCWSEFSEDLIQGSRSCILRWLHALYAILTACFSESHRMLLINTSWHSCEKKSKSYATDSNISCRWECVSWYVMGPVFAARASMLWITIVTQALLDVIIQSVFLLINGNNNGVSVHGHNLLMSTQNNNSNDSKRGHISGMFQKIIVDSGGSPFWVFIGIGYGTYILLKDCIVPITNLVNLMHSAIDCVRKCSAYAMEYS